MAHRLLTTALHLELDAPYSVVGGVVREGISQRTHSIVEIASTHDLDLRPLLGEEVVLEIGGIEDRRWTLRLTAAALLGEKDGSYRHRLDLYDPLWMLGLSKTNRKYRNQSAKEIATRVLGEHGVAHLWQIAEEPPTRKFCAQYDETNLAFVERILESEGIYYGFDQQGTLLLGDRSPAVPRLVQTTPFGLITPGSALDAGDVGVFELFACARVQSGGTTLGDYNWKKPEVLLRESAFDEADADLERYVYPAGYRKPEQGQRLAKLRLEALRAEARTVEGRSSVPRFQPAVGFELADTLGDQLAGEHVLTWVEHRFRHHELDARVAEIAAAEGYENRFRAIPRATPFRPPLTHHRPQVAGSHTAMVRGPSGEEIHTDPHGRFRAQLHWDREAVGTDEDSRWLRKMQEVQSGMTLARTGWEMYVGYIDGDPDRPIGLGRAINGEAVPAYQLPGHMNTMSMKTPSSPATGGFSELKLDDTAGSQMFYLRAEKDYDGLVKRNQSWDIGNDEVHEVGTDLSRQITQNRTVQVGGNNAQTYGENLAVKVQGSSSKQIGGMMEIKLASGATIRIDGSDTEIVGGLRLTIAGSFSTPDLATLAQSAAEKFVRTASPGAGALYDKAQAASKLPAMIDGLPDQALGTMKGYLEQLQGWPESYLEGFGEGLGDEAWKAFEKAFQEKFEPKKKDDPVEGVLEGASAGAEAALDAAWSKLETLPADAKAQATAQLEEMAEEIQGYLPTEENIQEALGAIKEELAEIEAAVEDLLPSTESLEKAVEDGLSELTEGLSTPLLKGDWQAALDMGIDVFCSGGIARSAKYTTLKVVGGAYVTASVKQTDWTAGTFYAETVGGVKLTTATSDIKQEVDGPQTVTVGGAMTRAAGSAVLIHAAGASTLTIGGDTSVEAGGLLAIKGASVVLDGASGLLLSGGGGEAQLSPGAISFSGNLELAAVGNIVVSAGKVDVT